MPKLSIITVAYNNLAGLQRTVESVVHQSWKDFEYIVIDGGSTDGSKAYLQTQTNAITYWVSEPDKGIYNAMNKGIAKATGEYVLFLNSGDHLQHTTVLETAHKQLPGSDLISFDLEMVGATTYLWRVPEQLRFSDLYFTSLPHPATFIKKDLFNKVGLYDETLKIVSDWKFFILALFIHKCSFTKINATLSTFYLDGISTTSNSKSERLVVLEAYFPQWITDYEELRKCRDVVGSNRVKMLTEIEQSTVGHKAVSFFFRLWIKLFSKKSLKDVLQ